MQVAINHGDPGSIIVSLDNDGGDGVIQLGANVVTTVAGDNFQAALFSGAAVNGITNTVLFDGFTQILIVLGFPVNRKGMFQELKEVCRVQAHRKGFTLFGDWQFLQVCIGRRCQSVIENLCDNDTFGAFCLLCHALCLLLVIYSSFRFGIASRNRFQRFNRLAVNKLPCGLVLRLACLPTLLCRGKECFSSDRDGLLFFTLTNLRLGFRLDRNFNLTFAAHRNRAFGIFLFGSVSRFTLEVSSRGLIFRLLGIGGRLAFALCGRGSGFAFLGVCGVCAFGSITGSCFRVSFLRLCGSFGVGIGCRCFSIRFLFLRLFTRCLFRLGRRCCLGGRCGILGIGFLLAGFLHYSRLFAISGFGDFCLLRLGSFAFLLRLLGRCFRGWRGWRGRWCRGSLGRLFGGIIRFLPRRSGGFGCLRCLGRRRWLLLRGRGCAGCFCSCIRLLNLGGRGGFVFWH